MTAHETTHGCAAGEIRIFRPGPTESASHLDGDSVCDGKGVMHAREGFHDAARVLQVARDLHST